MRHQNNVLINMLKHAATSAAICIGLFSSPFAAKAGTVEGLLIFQSGERARAGEVNQNFGEVKNAVDDNDRRIVDNTSGVAENRDRLDALESGLDANTLNGFSADQIVRAGYAEEIGSLNDFSTPDFESIVGLTVTAPSAGFLMIWTSINAEYDFNSRPDNVDMDCQIELDGERASIVVDQEFAEVPGGTNSGESIAFSTMTPVSRDVHDVDITCRTTGAGAVFVKQRSVMTLFVPFEDTTSEGGIILPQPIGLPQLPIPSPTVP
jgi:hypothetical protein